MSGTSAAYFDYLPEYGKTLNHKLGRHVEIDKIDFWRKNRLLDHVWRANLASGFIF